MDSWGGGTAQGLQAAMGCPRLQHAWPVGAHEMKDSILPRFAAKWSHCLPPASSPWWRTTQETPGADAPSVSGLAARCAVCRALRDPQSSLPTPTAPRGRHCPAWVCFLSQQTFGLSVEPGMWVQEGDREPAGWVGSLAWISSAPGAVGPASAWARQEQREGFWEEGEN